MIIIKVDCCGRPQTSSDAMRFKRLDILRRYAGERVKQYYLGSINIVVSNQKVKKSLLTFHILLIT